MSWEQEWEHIDKIEFLPIEFHSFGAKQEVKITHKGKTTKHCHSLHSQYYCDSKESRTLLEMGFLAVQAITSLFTTELITTPVLFVSQKPARCQNQFDIFLRTLKWVFAWTISHDLGLDWEPIRDHNVEEIFTLSSTDFVPLDPKDQVMLSLSFGKESLLSAALLNKLGFCNYRATVNTTSYPTDFLGVPGHHTLYLIKYFYTHKNLLSKYMHTDAIATETNTTEFLTRIAPKSFGRVHFPFFLSLYFLHAAIAYTHNIKRIVYGHEWECTYTLTSHKSELPYQTSDFIQSNYCLTQLNQLFESFGYAINMISIVQNLTEVQTQALLPILSPELASLQNSCWLFDLDHPWCGKCSKCQRICYLTTMLNNNLNEHIPLSLGILKTISNLTAAQLFDGSWTQSSYQATIMKHFTRWLQAAYKQKFESSKPAAALCDPLTLKALSQLYTDHDHLNPYQTYPALGEILKIALYDFLHTEIFMRLRTLKEK